MTRLMQVASAVGSCLSLLACATPPQPSLPGLVITDVTVISPERVEPLTHAYVRIVGVKISEVSDRPLRGERHIDGKGRFVIPGKIAHLLLLKANPLESVKACDSIETVFLHGRPVDREELSARQPLP